MNIEAKISLRDRILAVAQDQMLTQGQGQLSLRKIAAELGVTPMAIYRHFANNEELQLAMLDIGFRRFGTCLARSQDGTSPLQRMTLLADGFIDFAADNPGFFELMFLSSQVPEGLRDRESLLAASRPTYAILVNITRDCIAAGDFAETRAEILAHDILAFCTGQAALFISGILSWSADDAKRQSREAFSRYIRAMAAGRPARL